MKKKRMKYYHGSLTFDWFAPHIIHNSIKFVNFDHVKYFIIRHSRMQLSVTFKFVEYDQSGFIAVGFSHYRFFVVVVVVAFDFSCGSLLDSFYLNYSFCACVYGSNHPINAAQRK